MIATFFFQCTDKDKNGSEKKRSDKKLLAGVVLIKAREKVLFFAVVKIGLLVVHEFSVHECLEWTFLRFSVEYQKSLLPGVVIR